MSEGEPAGPSLKARVASGTKWSALDNGAQQALSLVIFVILGRLLSPELFGIVSTALIFVLLMRSAVLNSIASALVVLRAPQDEDYDTGFWLCVAIAAIAVGLLLLAAAPLADFYRIAQFDDVIRATSVIVVLSALSYAHVGWARRNFQFRALAMRNTISTAIGGAVGIGVALGGYGIAALILNQVIAALLALLLIWRAIPWRPRLRFSKQSARAIMATALPHGLNQSLQFIAQNFDTALVTWLLGPFTGGLYAVAKRVVNSAQIAITQPIMSVTLPAFAEVAGDPPRFANAAVRVGSVVMALTAPLFAGIAITAPFAVAALFGPKWAGAAPIMAIVAAFAIVLPSLGVLNQIALTLGRARMILALTLAQIALALAAIALVPVRDALTIALCLAAPSAIVFVATLALLARAPAFPLGRYLLAIGRPLVCAALMAAALLAVPNLGMGPLVQLAALAALGAAVYTLAALLLARDALREMTAFAAGLAGKKGAK